MIKEFMNTYVAVGQEKSSIADAELVHSLYQRIMKMGSGYSPVFGTTNVKQPVKFIGIFSDSTQGSDTYCELHAVPSITTPLFHQQKAQEISIHRLAFNKLSTPEWAVKIVKCNGYFYYWNGSETFELVNFHLKDEDSLISKYRPEAEQLRKETFEKFEVVLSDNANEWRPDVMYKGCQLKLMYRGRYHAVLQDVHGAEYWAYNHAIESINESKNKVVQGAVELLYDNNIENVSDSIEILNKLYDLGYLVIPEDAE